MVLLFNGVIEGLRSRKDKTLAVTVGTQELTAKEGAGLFGLQGEYVYIAVKVDEFNQKEVDAIKDAELDYVGKRKTLSQRLRGVMYVLWKKHLEDDYPEFNEYYRDQMETMIEGVKSTLDVMDEADK